MHINTPAEREILKFIVAMCDVRDDEDEVKQVIEDRLATMHKDLHAVYLKVALRVVMAQFYGFVARRLDGEVGYDLVDDMLDYQRRANEGLLDPRGDAPKRPHLEVVADA